MGKREALIGRRMRKRWGCARFSHSRPIIRPYGAPSSDKEGLICGGLLWEAVSLT